MGPVSVSVSGRRSHQLRPVLLGSRHPGDENGLSVVRRRKFYLRHARWIRDAGPFDGVAASGLDVGERLCCDDIHPQRIRLKSRTRQSTVRCDRGGLGFGSWLCRRQGHSIRSAVRSVSQPCSVVDDPGGVCEECGWRHSLRAGASRSLRRVHDDGPDLSPVFSRLRVRPARISESTTETRATFVGVD